MKIIVIAAVGLNNEIGKDNELLWRLPNDMKFFMETTKGHPVIMGRKTYESIPKKIRPLSERTNIVISSTKDFSGEGAIMTSNFFHALGKVEAQYKDKVFIIGGATIYERAMKYADELIITEVDAKFEDADTFFPKYEGDGKWNGRVIFRQEVDDKHHHDFEIVRYRRA